MAEGQGKESQQKEAKAKPREAEKDEAASWLQTAKVTVTLLPRHKRLLEQLHRLLDASPSAEKPTGSTIFAVMADVVADRLTKEGVLKPLDEKSADEQLREGRKHLDTVKEKEVKDEAEAPVSDAARTGPVEPPFGAAEKAPTA